MLPMPEAPFTEEVPVADKYGRVRIGRAIMRPGQMRGMAVQTTYQLMMIQTGEAFVTVGRRPPCHVPAGHVMLIRPEYHGHRRTVGTTPSHQTWVAVLPEVLSGEQLKDLGAAPFMLPLSPQMDRLQEAAVECYQRYPAAEAVLCPLVVSMLMLYVEEARARGLLAEPPWHHPAVETAREFIRRHLNEPLDLRTLAAAAHVTPEHLVRLFHRELGTTPLRYVWAERVRAGVHLLQYSDLSIAEVAARTGFRATDHFIRHVRTATGLRPRELRRQSRDGAEILQEATSSAPHSSASRLQQREELPRDTQ